MENITVEKSKLLDTLQTNREAHRELFLEAQRVYKQKVIEAFEDRLRLARESSAPISTHFALPEPRDFTEEFDRAIEMIKWSVGDTVELSEHDFQRYVLNDWEWARQFVASTAAYVAS